MTAGSERGRHMKSDIKRRRLLDNTESGSETDGSTRSGRPRWKRSRRDTDEKKPRSFCCPYFKKDPIHHMDCLTFNLRRIQDVKQHLQRKHYQPSIYCPVCQLEFSDIHYRDQHIRRRACNEVSSRTEPSAGRIPADKQEQLRARHRGSDWDQWFSMWRIIFDGAPAPSSPYQTTMIEEVAEFLRGFWRQHQDAIVSDISDTTPQTTQSAALDRSQLSGFVSEALSRLVGKLNEAIHDDDTRSAATSPSTGDSRAASIIIASPDDSRAASIITASPEGALVPYPTPPPMLMHPFDKVCEEPAVAVIPQPLVPAANFDSFGGAYPSLGDHECYKWEGFDLEGWNFSLPEGHIELPNLALNEVQDSPDEKMIRSDTSVCSEFQPSHEVHPLSKHCGHKGGV